MLEDIIGALQGIVIQLVLSCLPKVIPLFYQASGFTDMHGKTSEYHEHGYTVTLYYKISSLVRSGGTENSVMVDEAVCTPTDGGFGRSI